MTPRPVFAELAAIEMGLPVDAPIRRMLIQSINTAPFSVGLGRLREEFIALYIGNAYQSYGLQMFAPLGRLMLAQSLAAETGLDVRETAAWLEELAFALIEDFHILRVVDGEPDWSELETELLRSIARRVFCSTADEARGLVLDIWPASIVGELRAVKHQLLSAGCLEPQVLSDTCYSALALISPTATSAAPRLLRALTSTCERLLDDPLRVLGWRICYFAKAPASEPWEVVVRHENRDADDKAHKLAGLLALLSPDAPELVGHMPERPVSESDLLHVLAGSRAAIDAGLFCKWMGIANDESPAAAVIESLIEDGKRCGLLFSVNDSARNRKSAVHRIGLTTLALRVLKPFQMEIDEVRVVRATKESIAHQGQGEAR